MFRHLALLTVLAVGSSFAADSDVPKSPKDELVTLRIADGFQVELVASEPAVVDPVAMAFDEKGRLFVVELRVYPNDGVAKGAKPNSRIVMLEDADGDGVFEKSTVFADKLRVPNSVMPYRGGVLVSDAPDILFLEDTNHDGQSDKTTVLLTGFDLANIQMLPNGLQWGLDNWVYALAGNGGNVTCPAKPGWTAPNLRNRGFRFHPDQPGELEPTSGGGQFGLTADDYGRWFTATNSQHLRHIVLPDRYLARNPHLPVTTTTLDIPEHGAAAKVFRISEFEAWRVDRTARRQNDPAMRQRLPSTELAPGGFITSGCSPTIYRADALPDDCYGDNFVCDPANNLIHRERLTSHGGTFIAKRVYSDREFLASTDNWFRPCCLTVGPDGGLYVADFYREVIETPLSLPDDIKAKYNLNSRGRGRIWRITAKGTKYTPGKLPAAMTTAELVAELAHKNSWRRLTAQRLLVEKQPKEAVEPLKKLATEAAFAPGRVHALWTLHGLNALDDKLIEAALKDTEPGVQIQTLILAEPRLNTNEVIRNAAIKLAIDADDTVRFQAAFSLGECDKPEVVTALTAILARSNNDSWTTMAALSSVKGSAAELLDRLLKADTKPYPLSKLATVAVRSDRAGVLKIVAKGEYPFERLGPVLELLGPPDIFWAEAEKIDPKVAKWYAAEINRLRNRMSNPGWGGDPSQYVHWLGLGKSRMVRPFAGSLLNPREPKYIQLAAMEALTRHPSDETYDLVLAAWPELSPDVRKAALDLLTIRKPAITKLLAAIEAGKVAPNQIDATRAAALKAHPDAAIRTKANKVLVSANKDRQKVIDDYKSSRDAKGDAAKGKALFAKTCAQCHKLDDVGNDVGANLVAALGNKTPDSLLIDILDPSREVDPRYLQYTLSTTDGRSMVGVVVGETASGVTLKIPDKGEVMVPRADIDKLTASTKSLMPDGLEQQVSKAEFADLLAYLMSVRAKK
jgi:putative membrane-bound dehydrogenase-like protein